LALRTGERGTRQREHDKQVPLPLSFRALEGRYLLVRCRGGFRRVTWIEPFFDLVFVAAVAEVGSLLSADYSPVGPFRYAFLF